MNHSRVILCTGGIGSGKSCVVQAFRTLGIPSYDCDRSAKELYDRGVYVNPSLPPATAPNECLLRTSLMATHTEEQIEESVAIIASVLHKHQIGI